MDKIIDLTHVLNSGMTVYPGSEFPKIEYIHTIKNHGYAETRLILQSHHGTHMDAPSHMVPGGKSLDQFDAGRFFGKAICIDCTKLNSSIININQIEAREKSLKEIDFVLFYTNWSSKWGTKSYLIDFPVLSNEVCQWLVQFNLKGIGIDTISLDKMETENFENHMIILGNDLIIIENLTNLDKLISENFNFSCFPIKYENADGSPVRAIAIM